MTTPDARTQIRAWWKAQLATGCPVDLDAAAEQATAQLIADPVFIAAVAESIVRPLVRDIGQRTVQQRSGGARAPRVQVGSTVMTKQQAMALVDREIDANRPHWSRLVRDQGEPVWFLGLDRQTLMREATRRKEQGVDRLREATFLLAVANNLTDGQAVADVWSEQELELLYDGIDVDVKAHRGNVTFAFQFDKGKAVGVA